MSDEPDKLDRKRWLGLGRPVLAVFAVLALYVLSVGPMSMLNFHGYLSYPVFRAIYAPVIRDHPELGPLNSAMDWYLRLWEPARK